MKLCVLALLAALFVFALAGCSPHEIIDIDKGTNSGYNYTQINVAEAGAYIDTAIANRKEFYKKDDSEEEKWFVIDLELDFAYTDYTDGVEQSTKFTLILKANWNIENNDESELFFRIVDSGKLATILGIYYLDNTMYVSLLDGVAGRENMNYRFEEVNFSTIAALLAPLLNNIGAKEGFEGIVLDPLALIASLAGTKMMSELTPFLNALGVDVSDFAPLIETLAPGFLFNLEDGKSAYEMSEDGSVQTVSKRVNVNTLFQLVKDFGGMIGGLGLDLPFDDISWSAFGLPDFDPIMQQFLGFSLAKLKENVWPQMTESFFKAISVKKEVNGAEAYVLDGLGLSFHCDPTDEYKNGQYQVDIEISPFYLGTKKDKIDISFSGLELSPDSAKYREGGLLNLEAQLSLDFEAPEGTVLTVGDVVGDTLDELLPANNLESLRNVPISFNGFNYLDPETGERYTKYRFDLEIKTDLDLFDGSRNNAEINLYSQNEKILSVYLVGTTIYVYTEGLKGAIFSIPNVSIPEIDLTELLFGEKGALSVAMPYLDPHYAAPETPVEGGGASNSGLSDAPSNAGPIDVMALLKELITYKSYYTWQGEKIENESGALTLPGGEDAPLIYEFDRAAFNQLMMHFLDYSDFGIESLRLETMLSHPQDSTKLIVELPKKVRLKLQVDRLAWLGKPEFDFTNVTEREYTPVGGDANFYVELGGEFKLGTQKEDDAAKIVLNLSDLIKTLTQNIFLDIGLNVSENAETKIRYEIRGNFDMKKKEAAKDLTYISFRDTSFALYLYAGDAEKHFLMLYYNGTDDMLYIDFSNLTELQRTIPLFKIFKPKQPNIKIKLGLDALLENKPVLNADVNAESANTDFLMAVMTGAGVSFGDPASAAALDPVDLVGRLLEGIFVGDDTLSIVASRQLLSVLFTVLGVDVFGDGTVLPGTNIFGSLNIMNPDPDKGFLELHLGLVGQGGAGSEFLKLDVHLLNKVDVTGNPENFEVVGSGFNADDYENLYNVMETLVVAFELRGKLELTPLGKDGFSLGEFLATLIGAKYVDPYFDTVQIGSDLEFELKANVDISGLNMPEGGSLVFDPTTLLNSEIQLEIYDRANGGNEKILGVYYKGQDLYLDLHYFLKENGYIRLTNAGDFIYNLVKGSATKTAERVYETLAGGSIRTGSNAALNEIRMNVLATLSPYGLTVALAEGALSNLLGGLLGIPSDKMIEFGAVEVEVSLEDGIDLRFETSVGSAAGISLSLGDLGLSANPDDKVLVLPPAGVNWATSDMATLLTSVLVRVEASVGVGGEGKIDLSPLISSLLSKSSDPTASKIDINVFIDNLGLTAELNAVVEADLNFQAIAESRFRLSLYNGAVSNGDVILTAIYLGNENKLYVKTQLFGICNDPDEFKELDIDKLAGSFMKNALAEANSGESAVEVRNTPLLGLFGANGEPDPMAQFIQILFVKGGIQLKVAEEALVFLFNSLGVDVSEFFQNFTLEAEGELSVSPLFLRLKASVGSPENPNGLEFELNLKNLSVAFGGEIDLADLKAAIGAGKVTTIDSFTSIGVKIAGSLKAEVSSGDQSGEIYFDALVKNILGAVQLPAGIDGATLSTLGLLFKVIGNDPGSYPKFGGTLYYELSGVINIVTVENLYLTLKLGTAPGANDVLDVVVRGNAAKGSTGVDIYVDAERLLGIKPFVIKNIVKFVGIFTGTGVNLRGVNPVTNHPYPTLNRGGEVKNLFAALTSAAPGTDAALANAIVLYLASNYEEFGLKAPIVLDVGAGALYGILNSLAGVDLGKYLEGHDVEAQLTAGGKDALLSLDLGLQGLISLGVNLQTPTVDLKPAVPDAPLSGYTVLDENFTTLRVTLEGKASLKGDFAADADPNSPTNPNTIRLANLIGNFLTGVNFDVLVNLLGDVDKTVKYTIDVAVNLKKLISGDFTGLSGRVEFFDTGDKLLIGAYYLDGNLYLDLTALNLGKIRIDNFAVFLGGIIGASPSSAPAEAMAALPSDAAAREGALNAAAAAAYVNILLGNDTGVVLEVTAEAVALILSSISVGDATLDGEMIKDTFHGILALKLGLFHYDPESDSVHILGLSAEIASYTAELSLDGAAIRFDDTDVRPGDFQNWQASFGVVGELSEWVYVKAALTFGWHLSDGMSVDFSDILGTFLKSQLDMLSISPVLKILNEFGQDFKLEIEGKIHFGNLMRDGTLLPDLLGSGGFNAEPLMDSQLAIRLISTTGGENREIVSLSYVDRALYVDLSAFSIGKVRIPDAYDFFAGMFAPGNTPAALSYALPYSSDPADNAGNSAAYVAKEVGVLGAFINLNISSSAVALHVGTSGLFAILNLVGLDLGGVGLTLEEIYNLVNPLGDLDIAVWLATKNHLLELALSLKAWTKDNEGNIIAPSDREIALTLGLDSDFSILLGDQKIPQNVVVIQDPESYDRLTDDALIGIATRLDFRIDLKQGSVETIYKDPLQSLIGSLLTQIALSVGVHILEDQSGVVTLSVEAEVPLLTVIAGITAGGFDLKGINARIKVLYAGNGGAEKCYATLVLNNGDLFADLSLLGGPKAMIKDLMGLVSGGFAAPASADEAEASAPSPAAGDEGDTELLPKLPISLELMSGGFFVTMRKAAFNTIFGLINVNGKNLGDWEITDDVVFQVGVTGADNPIYGADGKSFKLGASLAFVEGQKELLTLGVDLNGIGAKFSRFGIERPDANEYANIKDVDTIVAETSLELNLAVNNNQEVNLQKTVEALFNALAVVNPLGIPLAPKIQTETALQETLRLDLWVAINLNAFASGSVQDILAGINVKASLYSLAHPDRFRIDIALDRSVAYIDATSVGLGKIRLPVNSLLERILGSSTPAAAAIRDSLYGYGGAAAAPMNTTEAEARKLLALTSLTFGKNGVTAIVAYDTIGTILKMLGVPVGDYIDGVIAPSVEIEVTDKFGFNIVAHILAGTGANGAEDEIAKLGLSLVGQTTNVDVKVSSVQKIESFAPADADAYTDYDKLKLTLDVNASISVDFLKGYIPLDDVLDLLISNMKMGIDVGETHGVSFGLNGKIGLDLERFLAKSPASLYGELSLNYAIVSAGGVYEQTIAKVYLTEDGVFVELKLQDLGLDLRVKIPDLSLTTLLWNLIDGKDPFASANPNPLYNVSGTSTVTAPFTPPLTTLLNAKAEGKEAERALDIVVALTSSELNVEISTMLLASILPILGLEIEDPDAIVESVLTSGKLAISVDPTFRIYLRLQKDPGGTYVDKDGNSHEIGGYAFELSLLQNTGISLDGADYYDFACRFTDSYTAEGYEMIASPDRFGGLLFSNFAESFLAFNLQKIVSGGAFDVIDDFLSTLGGKVEIGLGVDFKQLVFDLSALFQNEDNAYFYIQIAEALKSAVKITVEFDTSLKGVIKDATLGVDAILNFENEYGDVLLNVMVRGGGSGVTSAYTDDVYPAVYVYSEVMGIPKLKINSPILKKFSHLDLNALLESLGLKVGGGTTPNASSTPGAAARNGILDNSDEGFVFQVGEGTINVGDLLGSVSINPGRLSIVLAKTIVQDLLAALLNFPFGEVEDISATLADGLYLNIELQKGFAFKMDLTTLEVDLGGRAVFGNTVDEVRKTLAGYSSLSQYQWAFEVESELTITDDLVSVFSLSKMTTPLIGADITIEAGEVLGTKLTFLLKGYIDFADLSNLNLQLAVVSGGKQYVNIMYVGRADDPNGSWVYLDLSGLGLPAIKLQLDVGSIVKNLLASLTATGEATGNAAGELIKAASAGAADALRPANEAAADPSAVLKSGDVQWGLDEGNTLDDVPFGSQLLLLAIGSKDVSVAITGALLSSLIHGLTSAFVMPDLNYLRIGYVEGKMTGLEVVLNEQNFRIAYSFTGNSSSEIGKAVQNPVNPNKNAIGEDLTYAMSDIGVIRNIFFALNMDIRIDTKNANGSKSSQIEGLEAFIETLVNVPDGTVDLAPQRASMILNFNLQLALDLVTLKNTQLALTLSMGDTDLLGVYFDGGALYADLSGLGLFEVKISGLDVITLIMNLLGGTLDLNGGLKVGELINGILPAAPQNAPGVSPRAGGYAADALRNAGGVAALPKIRVVLTNDSVFVMPSMSAIGAIVEKATGKPLGFELPDLAEIRLGINLKEGLNNLSLKLKLDNFNNGAEISIPSDGGLAIRLNDTLTKVAMPTNFDQYGGISGLALSNGGISLNTAALVSSLIDSIDAPNSLGIYLKKRNSYFKNTSTDSYRQGSILPGKNPLGSAADNGFYDSGDFINNRKTSAAIVARRDQATNYLELSVAANGNRIMVRYDACAIKLYIQELNIDILGSALLSKIVASIINSFVKDGIFITNLVIPNLIAPPDPIIGSIGSLSGTLADENGKPLEGVMVTLKKGDRTREALTDALGNYAFTGLETGEYAVSFTKPGYFDVIREAVEVKNMQELEEAQRFDIEMFALSSTTGTYTKIGFYGNVYVKGSNFRTPIPGAEVFIDNRRIGDTDQNGRYGVYYDGAVYGARHSIIVKAPGYKTAELTVEIEKSNQDVTKNIELEPLEASKGVLKGKFVEKVKIFTDKDGKFISYGPLDAVGGTVGYRPVTSGLEIWLKKDGATILNPSALLTPYNFLGEDDQGTRLGTLESDGSFSIPNLDYGTYLVKIRSTTFENFDLEGFSITFTAGDPTYIFEGTAVEKPDGTETDRVFNGQIVLTRRAATHFSENTVTDTTVAGVRIRLGADVLDGDNNGSGDGDVVSGKFETGGADNTDGVTYIEAWLGENLAAGLFDTVHNLLSSGLSALTTAVAVGSGFHDTGADARYTPIDLVQTGGVYNENDLTVYDYRFGSRAEYLRYETVFTEKFASALLRNVLGGLIGGAIGNLPGFLQNIIFGALHSTFGSVGEILGTIFPFTIPYSFAENKDLPGNPLETYNNQGWLTEGTIAGNGGTPELTRTVEYAEKSVYARIKLNQSNQGGLLESIKLFVNGAGYRNRDSMGALNGDFTVNGVNLLGPLQTVRAGAKVADARGTMDEWLRKNTVNDYIVIEDYAIDPLTSEKYLYNQYYIYNNEQDPTTDEFMELDIINTGLYLKSAKALGEFTNLNGDGSYGQTIELPDRIEFNNPYDPSDFTVYGGTWAAQTGGVRTNTDRTKTPVEISDLLPTRNKVAFRSGGSTGSSGAAVNWSMSVVDFTPKGGSYQIIGSCLNLDIRIPCVVKGREISENDILNILGDGAIPAIDPYAYNEYYYKESLPKSFREGTQTVYRGDDPQGKDQTGKYVFDDLRWDLSDIRIDNKGTTAAEPCYMTLTYGFAGSGKGKVRVPVAVLDRTAQSISVSVEGSVGNLGISNSEIVFDPFEIDAAAARTALTNLAEVKNILGQITRLGAVARLSTPTGAVETPIRAVDLGTFRGVDFDNLTYNQNGEAVYTIYLTVENSVGDRTRMPVTVKIRDKRVDRSTLQDFSEAERTIRPYRKYGMYDKDLGLNSLPASVTVTYKDGSAKTLVKDTDYVWGLDLGAGGIVLQGKRADGADNWRGLLDAKGGTYRFRIFALDGSDVFHESVYGIDLIVAPTRITSAEPVTFDPYGEIRLPSELTVGLNNAAPVSGDRANVRFPGFTEDMIAPNFAGSVSYADAEIYDALFETVTLPGVKITVRQANVETLVFPDNEDGRPYAINPYLAAGQIEKLIKDPSTYLTVVGAPGVKVYKDLFDVVSFRIADATLSKVRVSVKVGNKGYDPGKAGAAQWTQEFVMSLRVLDMTDAVVAPIEVDTVYDGLPKEVSVSIPGGEPFAVPVDYLYDRTTGIVDGAESGAAADFYKMSEAKVWFVPKNLPGVTQNVTVRVASNAGGANEVASYVLDGDRHGESFYAFQNLPLPETASLTFENGAVKAGLPVVWDTVEGYRNENGTAQFTGRIGAAEYGYYPVRYALEIQKDSLGMVDLPEVIRLDPLKSFEEQLAVYRTVSANNAFGAVILNAEFPIAEISRNWQGTGEIVYPVRLGRRIALASGDAFVYEEVPVKIQTLRREAAKISEQLIGNVYNEIDFGAIERVTVEFESGEIKASEVRLSDWSGLDTIDYRKANVYTVRVTVFGGDPDLRQTVEVRVDVRSAVLADAYRTYENGRLSGKVNGLIGEVDAAGNPVYTVVDPFEGFDPKSMPAELWGRFDGFDEPIKLKADWSVDHIVNAMSVAGGDFTVADHNAGAVTLYLEKDGQRIRPQQLAFEVRVLKRTVESIGFSKDPNASQQSEYTTLPFDDDNASKPESDRRLYYKMFLNPYELASYNENPAALDFAYYKAMKVSLSVGDPLYFNVENMEYEIYDADTLRPTVLSELYRGRNVIVRIVANRENLRDKNGKQVLAADALVLSEIRVRIHNMTYTAGGTIPSDFTVDLYKEYFDYGEASNVLSIDELRRNIKDITTNVTISGTDPVTRIDPVTGEVKTELVTANFDSITVGTGRLNVNYLGETGYLEYTFGNEVGGMQTVSVPVRYVRRVLGEAFDPEKTEHYYTKKADGLYTMGTLDPTMVINPAYTKNFEEGFLYDPFASYTLDSFFLSESGTTRFLTDGGASETVKKAIPLEWKRGKVYVDKNGGDFTVTAVVRVSDGDAFIEQNLKYRFRVLKRKAIYATSADDPKGDNLKALLRDKTNSVIRAYDYIGYDDVDAAVGQNLFVNAGVPFQVAFEEGCPIEYNFGARAGEVSVNGGSLVPEGAFNMTFHIDSLKPLNSKGNDVRFEMTIPGYGLGAVGQQSLYLYVKSEKQEIVSVKTWITSDHSVDQAVPFIGFFTQGIAMEDGFTSATTGLQAIESIGADNNATKVNNQYFFIKRGGLVLPDTLSVTVKNETGATRTYAVENVNWTGANANRFTVRYTGGTYSPSFSMPVDNQNYSFVIQAEPMLFRGRGGVMVDTTGTPYGKDEVILLPMRENLTGDADTVVTDNGTPVIDSANYVAGGNYGYAVTFGNREKVSFNGVNGGGNYRNSYNLWDFTSIDFDNTSAVQYATLTLGGKGGEKVKWALRIADKTEIGTSMQTVQLAGAGGSASANVAFDFTYGDMGTLGGNAQGRLPNRFYQYFDGQRKSSAIPVTYGGLLSDNLGSYLDGSGNNRTNFTYDANSRTVSVVSKNAATEAPIATLQTDVSGGATLKKPVSKAAAIRWTATTYRAYPAPSEEVGGVLYFGMYPYMATASNKTVSAYFRNPENPMYSFNALAPDAAAGGWTYPTGLVADSTSGGEQDLYLIPPFENGAAAAQPTIPVYQVVKGSVFDVKYLPLFTIGNSVYYVPWHLADVYEIGKPEWKYDAGFVTVPSPSSAVPGEGGTSSTVFSHGTSYNETLAGGIRAIDTTKTGTRYTLVLRIPGASSANGNFQLIVAIDVVEPIE